MINSKLKTQNSKLVLLVVAFLLLAGLYSAVVPLGEGPDEPGHAGYVFFLAREGRLPVQRAERAKSDVPGEGHQPPLAYALAAPLVAWLPPDQRRVDQPGNPRFTWSGGSELNAVAHGSREYWPWSGPVLAWHLARLVAGALGAATVVFTYLAARSLEARWTMDDGRWTSAQSIENASSSIVYRLSSVPLLAAALVAFNPQFLFVSALVTNDALLVTLCAAMLWLAVRPPTTNDQRPTTNDEKASFWSLVLRPWSFVRIASATERRAVAHATALGLLLGLALLTKQSAIILAPVALLSVLEHCRLLGPVRRGSGGSFTLSPGHLVTLSMFLAAALLVSGWWYVRNWQVYGDPLGLAAFQAEFATQAFEPGRLEAWISALKQLHSSFWARFGWMNVRPPGWAIWLFTAVEIVAVIGLFRRWTMDDGRRGTGNETRTVRASSSAGSWRTALSSIVYRLSSSTGHWALLALPLLSFAWVVSFAFTAGLVAWQGRLLFPALPAIAILLAAGLFAWQRTTNDERRTTNGIGVWGQDVGRWSLVVGLIALAAWLPFGAIGPAYPMHTLPEQVARERLGTQVYGRLGRPGDPGAELVGWRLAGTLRPGAALDLALMWHAVGRQSRNWTVFVHLVDADEAIVAEDNRQPHDGAFPMTQWVMGDWVEDHHPLTLPVNLAPGTYRLRVGLWDPRSGKRAAVYDQKSKLIGDYLEVGSITIRG